jgi:DNA-binding transcriptional LysR family regulator
MKPFLILALAILSACSRFPADTDGTLDRVTNGELRVGLVHAGAGASELLSFTRQLSARTSSRIQLVTGSAEPMLMKLEAGELDLVLGQFDRSSPWQQRITFSRPISTTEKKGAAPELKAAMRNGEHAWAMEVDRTALAFAGEAK